MPVYEYVCAQCEHAFEELVIGGEEVACPRCSSAKLRKRFSTFATNGEPDNLRASAYRSSGSSCGTCGDPRGPGACSLD
jgi:putative FmdB family regulatory protein